MGAVGPRPRPTVTQCAPLPLLIFVDIVQIQCILEAIIQRWAAQDADQDLPAIVIKQRQQAVARRLGRAGLQADDIGAVELRLRIHHPVGIDPQAAFAADEGHLLLLTGGILPDQRLRQSQFGNFQKVLRGGAVALGGSAVRGDKEGVLQPLLPGPSVHVILQQEKLIQVYH